MSRILNLRGTSGTGKSYIVQMIRDSPDYVSCTPQRVMNRRQPIGYTHHRTNGAPLFIVGHYETACGGCDNISWGFQYIYQLINEKAELGLDVVFEGLVMCSDVVRCIDLHRRNQLLVIEIDTPLAACEQAIVSRRAERGNFKPLDMHNTVRKAKALVPQRARFKDAGVDFRLLNRADALAASLNFLSIRAPGRSASAGAGLL